MAQQVSILGIGNLLMGDEGFGTHVIRHLEACYSFPEDVTLHDVGTASIYLAPVLEGSDRVMVVDVISSDNPPGTFEFLDGDDIKGRNIQSHMSPHQVGILEIMEICRFRGKAPERLEFFCVVPERIETGVELTPLLQSRVGDMGMEIVKRLKRDGYQIKKA